ncbi:MAG: hypothetical protein RIF33_21990 [Cyclobacteriaceae bacterium]
MYDIKLLLILFLVVMQHPESLAQKDKEAKNNFRQAQKAYKAGSYETAIKMSVMALSGTLKKKNYTKLVEAMNSGFMHYYGEVMSETSNAKKYTKSYNGRISVESAQKLINKYTALHKTIIRIRSLGEPILSDTNIDQGLFIDYNPEIQQAHTVFEEHKEKYVSEEYQAGIELLSIPSKRSGLLAYRRFNNVLYYEKSGYKDTNQKRLAAINMARYTVAFEPIEVAQNIPSGSEVLSRVNASTWKSIKAKADQSKLLLLNSTSEGEVVITIQITDFQYSAGEIVTSRDERNKEIVVREEKIKNSEGKEEVIKVKKAVSGTYTTYTQQYEGILKGRVILYNNIEDKVLKDSPITSLHRVYNEWYSSSGDKRVLSKGERESIGDKKPAAPARGTLALGASNDFADNLFNVSSQALDSLFKQ